MSKYKLKIFYPNYFTSRGVSHACISIARGMRSILNVTVMGISSDKSIKDAFYKDAIPSFLKRIAYKLFSDKLLHKIAEYRFLNSVEQGDIIYLWPGASVALFEKLHNKCHIIIRENINTHQLLAKELLDWEYSATGLKGYHTIAEDDIREEMTIQELAHLVYSPSPEVSLSLIKCGVAPETILDVSYGLRKSEILPERNEKNENQQPLIALFVGRICVRKGIHLLINAWKKANINGELLLVGAIDENIREFVEHHLSANIKHVSYVNDLKPIYRGADIFVLPSIEEGSPLVTYLALGAGIPSLVSPMGGGGIIDDDTGFVIEPHDEDKWVEALKKLSTDKQLRETMGRNAHNKASYYTWKNVGERRAKLLLEKLQKMETRH